MTILELISSMILVQADLRCFFYRKPSLVLPVHAFIYAHISKAMALGIIGLICFLIPGPVYFIIVNH